jgi:hypothetical protein
MTELLWDQTGEKEYETGVDKGVLFVTNEDGSYGDGVAWNGLTTVTESPAGAESTKTYADNIVYGNLISAETFGGTIEAYMYPTVFGMCDGSAELAPGVTIGQQARRIFGFAYRTRVGNDTNATDHGYKIHLVYGAQAAPSEKAYATINESPEMMGLSWEISTTPVATPGGRKPTASLVIDSTKVDPTLLAAFEGILYGDADTDARLPLPAEVADLFSAGVLTQVDLTVNANQPVYNAGTHVVTLPAVTGIQWKINGVNKAPGAQPALSAGQVANIQATPLPGKTIKGDDDWSYAF